MPGLDESLTRLAAHALRRRVGSDQLGVLGLKPLELVHQLVEVGVGKFTIIQHVVAILVVPDFLAQSFDFFPNGRAGHDWDLILPATGYCLFAFRIRPRPNAARPTLDGGFFIPSSNSFSTTALLCSWSRDAYSSATRRLPSARRCSFSTAEEASALTNSLR